MYIFSLLPIKEASLTFVVTGALYVVQQSVGDEKKEVSISLNDIILSFCCTCVFESTFLYR